MSLSREEVNRPIRNSVDTDIKFSRNTISSSKQTDG
jgi:hypothetical protein